MQRFDENMTHHNQEERVYVAGQTMFGAINFYLNNRLFYGKPVWKLDDVKSSVKLPFYLDSVEQISDKE